MKRSRRKAAKPVRDALAGKALHPHWDSLRRELTLDGQVVKRFRVPARNQETVLMAFEEEGWPAVVLDPLPPQDEQDGKQRLHDTIKSLNRSRLARVIRFSGDGTGEGVLWERSDGWR
jgi:hypothetical protein